MNQCDNEEAKQEFYYELQTGTRREKVTRVLDQTTQTKKSCENTESETWKKMGLFTDFCSLSDLVVGGSVIPYNTVNREKKT